MERTVLLKTQLYEASKLGKLKNFNYQRLAVILLDNFIEIQLRQKIQNVLHIDNLFISMQKKYNQKERNKIFSYYDELLKASTKENFITKDEQIKLNFCHNVRNNLYHKINEEELLVKIALKILHNIIKKRQPEWGNGMIGTSIRGTNFDPFTKKKKSSPWYNSNTKEEWEYFLQKYFNFIDNREKKIQSLLKQSIKSKIKKTRENISFIQDEYTIYFPYSKNWSFNEYCLYYSFIIIKETEIAQIMEDKHSREEMYKNSFLKYKQNWKNLNKDILYKINRKADGIGKASETKALEKYISIMVKMKLIFDVFEKASMDLDKEIQFHIDLARGK